ncbi:phosphomannose isomerase type II C-terminal cupin domain [Synechococcus sp. Tobar12-5m-g]|uniref:phosphomannose isomerase type II C-terminal cupin domain n=1 Tax=unclassified Synechococcus TaxID=2626047 RepID=UPI0020CCB209|nr:MULTISPECIES: phosphomannose isomerase type II C-terminal cupin domain [unclassified Synechococcus]MCP9771054.1 phosphomannose isomerase type II C-terminal cupin domain [Synechococcus sp. Tobar12-5m-g]MCP9871994.1 phosphomannose isomerase type II C-terminal cupin domain [Synechococcus sp. Cruz CV-v-12]
MKKGEQERWPRPWGWFECLDRGPDHQVKRLHLMAGQRISRQCHRQRSEHWVVVEGQGVLERDGEVFEATPGTSLQIPLGSIHRATAGSAPLVIVEVQIGSRLEEDDIERLEDDYGRAAGP